MANRNTPSPLKKIPLLNVFVHDITMDQLVENFDQGLLLTLHTEMLMKLQNDPEFYEVFQHFDLVTCDSQVLAFATRFLGTPVRERVSGSDFFPKFYMHHKDNPEVTVFMCGGQPGIAEIAAQKINEKVGRDIIIGTDAPSFDYENDPAEVDRLIDAINASGATALLVGLGGGRQEKFIVKYRSRMPNVRMYLPLGGTIDYEAGTFKRPPAWVTNVGGEWLYRLVKEPGKRWRRYLIHDPKVLPRLFAQRFGLYRNPFADEPAEQAKQS